MSREPRPAGSRALVLTVVLDLLLPIAVFYVARARGADAVTALLLGAIAPGIRAVTALLRSRSIEWLAVVVLTVTLASAATSTLSGSPRFLLAKDGAITALLGLTMLATVRSRRPALYAIGREVLAGTGNSTEAWDERWSTSDTFRRLWRTLTVLWGAGLLLDAALRATFAYTLPVDTVPAVTTAQWIVLLVALNLVSQLYLRRPVHRHLVFDKPQPTEATRQGHPDQCANEPLHQRDRHLQRRDRAHRAGLGLAWTVPRPCGFQTNALRWLPQLAAGDVVRGPWADIPTASSIRPTSRRSGPVLAAGFAAREQPLEECGCELAVGRVELFEERLVGGKHRKQRVGREPLAAPREAHPDGAAVIGIGRALDESGAREPVQAGGHRARRDERGACELTRVRAAGIAAASQRVDDVEVAEAELERLQGADERSLQVPGHSSSRPTTSSQLRLPRRPSADHLVHGIHALKSPGGAPTVASNDSVLRFYAVWWAAQGPAAWHLARDPDLDPRRLRALCATTFLGGLARLAAARTSGPPHPLFLGLTVMELLAPPVLLALRRQLSHARRERVSA